MRSYTLDALSIAKLTFYLVRENTKDTSEVKLTLDMATAAQLQNDPTWRVMIFCAVDNGLNHYQQSDIAFPHQMEIKVNLEDVKTNLRGLKNKPGSTRPADITDLLRKKPTYSNTISMTYALTSKASPHSASSVGFPSSEESILIMKGLTCDHD